MSYFIRRNCAGCVLGGEAPHPHLILSGRKSAFLKPNTSNKGFASMSLEKRREIAAKGGKAAQAKGTGHQFTSEEARAAGRIGGESLSKNRAHMAEIGRKGGAARGTACRDAKLSAHRNGDLE